MWLNILTNSFHSKKYVTDTFFFTEYDKGYTFIYFMIPKHVEPITERSKTLREVK